MRQLPPEITRINLDGPPSEKRPKPKTPKHDSSPNEIARSRESACSGSRASLSSSFNYCTRRKTRTFDLATAGRASRK